MRILMVSPTLPWPVDMGDKIRIYHVLRELAGLGHEVTFLSLAQDSYDPSDLQTLKSYCRELLVVPIKNRSRLHAAVKSIISRKPYRLAKFESQKLKQAVAQALRKDYDILWVHFMETLANLPQSYTRKRRLLVVLDQHNADEHFWETYARGGWPWTRLFAKINLWELRRLQASVLKPVDVIMSVSKKDARFTQARLPNPATQVWVVPNGVDTESFRLPDTAERKNHIIFCGAMDVLMNIDAVEWFARRIFPEVRNTVPDAEFWIVGRNPVSRIKALNSLPGVHVTGRVKDVRPYYTKAKVAVAPFRYGGGTKIKVLEAMALGVPVVATPVGCQGIEVVFGRHLFKEEDGKTFAQRVINLLQNERLRHRVAAEARKLVTEQYSWHAVFRHAIKRLEGMVKSV